MDEGAFAVSFVVALSLVCLKWILAFGTDCSRATGIAGAMPET
jgi:hypothetical protein